MSTTHYQYQFFIIFYFYMCKQQLKLQKIRIHTSSHDTCMQRFCECRTTVYKYIKGINPFHLNADYILKYPENVIEFLFLGFFFEDLPCHHQSPVNKEKKNKQSSTDSSHFQTACRRDAGVYPCLGSQAGKHHGWTARQTQGQLDQMPSHYYR